MSFFGIKEQIESLKNKIDRMDCRLGSDSGILSSKSAHSRIDEVEQKIYELERYLNIARVRQPERTFYEEVEDDDEE